MQILKIGDRTSDNSLAVLDEDRLCYSVRSVSNGSTGVRTISKALLAEWVAAYAETPNAPAQEVRTRLVGKSEVDKFEYGYAGTLAKLAKMILGKHQLFVPRPIILPNSVGGLRRIVVRGKTPRQRNTFLISRR